jgi:hypothetical protein
MALHTKTKETADTEIKIEAGAQAAAPVTGGFPTGGCNFEDQSGNTCRGNI